MRDGEMKDIKSIMASGGLGIDLETMRRKAEIFRTWEEIVGAELAAVLKPKEFKGHTLIISTESSAWAQEAHFMADKLINKVNKAAGLPIISSIKVVIGKR